MRVSYEETVPAGDSPVTLAEAKAHCRVEGGEDNDLIAGLIGAATKYAQDYQWSQLISATWKQRIYQFPDGEIELHPNPVTAVASVTYVDINGDTQTLTENTDYVVDTRRKPAIIRAAYNTWWPAARGYADDVTIQFTAGYGTRSAVPQHTKQAILMLVAHWYDNRGNGCESVSAPQYIDVLLSMNSFKVMY